MLTVSADMGGGHEATAAALEEAVCTIWPGTETKRLDTLDVMGPGIGPWFRRIYVSNVEDTPWLYELFYSSLWRHRWFTRASKRFTGSWCGRRLKDEIDRFAPDLILSTYPLGSSGLAWLRRHRGLRVPTAAYVSDFSPHPFWVYADLDSNVLMHEVAVPVALAGEPGARVQVCAPPVVGRFHPGEKQQARAELGLPTDRFTVLVSCGAYAFGDTDATVRALLRAAPEVQVVAACGRNEQTKRRLEALGEPAERLLAMGWTDQMPRYVQAADLVLSNAGGATALEALATGRPLLMSQPIAAHGKANADLMVVAGLAELCTTTEALENYVRAAVRDATVLDRLTERAQAHRDGHDLATGLQTLTARDRDGGRWRVRPQDAFFSYVERGAALQEIGATLELDEVAPGQELSRDALRRAIADSVISLSPLRQRVVSRGRLWWRPSDVDLDEHVTVEEVAGGAGAVQEAVDRFWSTPMRRDRPAWQAHLVRSDGSTRSMLALRMHHVYGDGISALGLFDRVLTPEPGDPLRERAPSVDSAPSGPVEHAKRVGLQAALTVRGLASLATRGRPPSHALNRPVGGSGRRTVMVGVPRTELRALGRAHRAHTHEVVLSLVADSLGRVLAQADLLTPGEPLRVMLPIAMRPPRMDRIFGNWTGSVAIDLPTAPMSFSERVGQVRAEVRRRVVRGEPQGAEAVMRMAGHLPASVHRWFAQTVYNRRFFNSIVSYMPAARGPRWCAGARCRALYPVLPLAHDVPLTVGVILHDETAGIGILMSDEVPLTHEQVRAAVLEAVRDARAEAGVDDGADSGDSAPGSDRSERSDRAPNGGT